ncbi:MAG: L-seryl-tRNA(Sec) selenium transferase [Actinobacteria bacterium]|nr:L-seryl-tRNA(Sec) selenium transferase [Actinomycetota bacterium]
MAEANPYRALPAVDELAGRFGERLPRSLRIDIARMALDQARLDIAEGRETDVDRLGAGLARAVENSAQQRVVNATGTLLHTNLGRAPWSDRALARAREAAAGYSNLELDLGSGERGRRGAYVSALLRSLTGAEDAVVVNNNASALLLTLAALAPGASVPVARGELIEIGGAYRLPEVMAAGGARLVEVGTTNRTRLGDYHTALQLHRCAAILKVHPSNYRIEGFVEEAGLGELAALAAAHEIPLIYDIGSGLLDAETPWIQGERPPWARQEPAARQSLQAGADLVLFSGDKLLGGPQAGLVAGSGDLISMLRANALSRALRPDGVTLAGLAATLEAYAEGTVEEIPFWRMALASFEGLEGRAERLAGKVGGTVGLGHSAIGAGSAPGARIPSPTIALDEGDRLFDCLLESAPAVLARREEGRLVIDLRCVDEEDDDTIADAILRCR